MKNIDKDNPWKDSPWDELFLKENNKEVTSFRELYEGNCNVDKPSPCDTCPNKGNICWCTLGNQIVY